MLQGKRLRGHCDGSPAEVRGTPKGG